MDMGGEDSLRIGPVGSSERQGRESAAGLALSVLLHGIALCLLLVVGVFGTEGSQGGLEIVPVEVESRVRALPRRRTSKPPICLKRMSHSRDRTGHRTALGITASGWRSFARSSSLACNASVRDGSATLPTAIVGVRGAGGIDDLCLEHDAGARDRYMDRHRDFAVSARNAVLLSSPIALPAGHYQDVMDMVLYLNPKDALR